MKFYRITTIQCVLIMAGMISLGSPGFLSAEETGNTVLNKTVYVKPSSEVAVRTGKGTEFKIVALVKDGSPLVLLEEDEFYARVQLANGKDGWVLSRFLGEKPPLEQLVASLEQEKEVFVKNEIETKRQLEELSIALTETKSKLGSVLAERDSVANDYENLQKATADVVKITTELEETKKNNGELRDQFAVLKQENDDLKKDRKMYWFLSGAGVLLLGMLLGRMPKPSRKRKSSLI